MENNLKNKTIFFAQHWGQKIVHWEIMAKIQILGASSLNDIMDTDYLELKPLSSITDEDSISLAELILKSKLKGAYVFNDGNNRRIYHEGTYTTIYHDFYCRPCAGDPVREMPFTAIDYLRSKGYALPWMGLSLEQLEEYGWIKIKNESHD